MARSAYKCALFFRFLAGKHYFLAFGGGKPLSCRNEIEKRFNLKAKIVSGYSKFDLPKEIKLCIENVERFEFTGLFVTGDKK